MPTDLLTLLDQLQDLYDRQSLPRAGHGACPGPRAGDALRTAQQAALPPAMRARLAANEARFGAQRQILEREAAYLVAEIKAAVVQHGASVKGATLHAVYVQGKAHWDDRALQGYAAAGHEELLAFRSTGKPSVSIRKATWSEDGA
jgi:hypothetical protein